MKTTIYLHIGMNKTGSSAIQRFFSTNRQLLAHRGVLYPRAGCVGGAHYGLSDALGFIQKRDGASGRHIENLDEMAESIFVEINSSKPSEVFLSSENFVLPKSVDKVREFFSGYNLKILVYLRRHDMWWPSSYNQAVRTVENPPWGRGFLPYFNYLSKKRPDIGDYRILLHNWALSFGKNNIIVRPYELQQNQPTLISDVLRSIGRDDLSLSYIYDCERVNDSVDMSTLALVDAIQRARIDRDVRAMLIHYALSNSCENEFGNSIDPSILLSLVEKYTDDYSYIAREYLGRDDGKLFYDPLPDPSVPWKKSRMLKLDTVVETVVMAMRSRRQPE